MEGITSNLIIRTSVPKPTGKGLGNITDQLNTLEEKLDKLSGKTYDIHVRIVVDNAQLQGALSSGTFTPARGSSPVSPVQDFPRGREVTSSPVRYSGTSSAGPTQFSGQTGYRVATRIDPDTGEEKRTVTKTHEEITPTSSTRTRTSDNLTVEEVSNLRNTVAKNLAKQRNVKAIKDDLLGAPSQEEKEDNIEREANLRERNREALAAQRASGGIDKERDINLRQLVDASLSEQRAQQRQANVRPKDVIDYERQGNLLEQVAAARKLQAQEEGAKKREETEVNYERQANLLERTNAANRLERQKQNAYKKQADEYVRGEDRKLSRGEIDKHRQELEGSGWQQRSAITQKNFTTGESGKVYEYYQVTGNAIQGYTVKTKILNENLGKVTEQTLDGTRALRYMGDSLQTAAAKVILWTTATVAIFGTIRAIREAADIVKELEINTVTMAQVGRGLGTSFEERSANAKHLTDSIIELETHIGGSAVEAQKAAETFLRAGQSEKEAMVSTRTAILASELSAESLENTSEYLEAAQLQFNLTASQTEGILNSMNALTLNYRVSLEDLLRSTSVAGGVFAGYKSTLEELSGITAVLAQTTGVSGVQIGNMLKSVQSRIDDINIKQEVFQRLGISFQNAEGDMKPMLQILLELKTRWGDLSSEVQRELEITMFGTRMRSLGHDALVKSREELEATVKAYTDSSTAASTFGQRSQTIEVAVGRLEAQFQKMANDTTGLGGAFKTLVDDANGLLQLLNSGPGRLALYTVSFLALNAVVGAVGASLIKTTKSTVSYVASIVNAALATRAAASVEIYSLEEELAATRAVTAAREADIYVLSEEVSAMEVETVAIEARTAATVELTGAEVAANAASGPIGLITMAITAAVVGLSYAYGQATAKALDQVDISKELTESIQSEIDADQRRIDSTKIQMDYIQDLIDRQRELNEERRKDPGNETELNSRLAQFGITGVNTETQAGLDAARKAAEKAEEDQALSIVKPDATGKTKFQKERDAIGRLSADARDAIDKARQDVDSSRRKLNKGGLLFGGSSDEAIEEEFQSSKKSSFSAWNNNVGELGIYIEKRKQLEKIEKEQGKILTDTEEKLQNNNKAESQALDTALKITSNREKEAKNAQSVREASKITDANRIFQKLNPIQYSIEQSAGAAAGASRLEIVAKQFGRVKEQVIDLAKAFDLLNASQSAEMQSKVQNDLEKELHDLISLSNELNTMKTERISFLEDASRAGGKLTEAFTQRNTALKRSATFAPQATQELDTVKARQEALAIEAVEQKNIMEVGSVASATDDQRLAATAARAREEEILSQLGDTEIERAQALLKLEADIANERRRSADEAMRALGMMSEEDKLRVRAQAAYFAGHPNKKISIEEQFYADAASNRILQQFGNHAERFDPNKPGNRAGDNTLIGSLVGAGYGTPYTLQKEEAAAAAERGGRTDQQLFQDYGRGRNNAHQASGEIAGKNVAGGGLVAEFMTGISNALRFDPRTGTSTRQQLNVKIGDINFQPMVQAFQATTTAIVQTAIDKQLSQIWAVARDLQAKLLKLPPAKNRS